MKSISQLRSSSPVAAPASAPKTSATKKMPQVSAASHNDAAIEAVATRDPGKAPGSATERSYIQADYGHTRSEIERVEQTSSFEGVKLESGGDDNGSSKKDP